MKKRRNRSTLALTDLHRIDDHLLVERADVLGFGDGEENTSDVHRLAFHSQQYDVVLSEKRFRFIISGI